MGFQSNQMLPVPAFSDNHQNVFELFGFNAWLTAFLPSSWDSCPPLAGLLQTYLVVRGATVMLDNRLICRRHEERHKNALCRSLGNGNLISRTGLYTACTKTFTGFGLYCEGLIYDSNRALIWYSRVHRIYTGLSITC